MTTTRTRRRTRSRALLAAATLPALLAAACDGGSSVEDHRVTAAVREYNLALVRAFSAGDAGLLLSAATESEAGRVEALIWGLAGQSMILDARQEGFTVEQVELRGESEATLTAVESWWYRHHDPKSDAVGQAPRRIRYRMEYALLKNDGLWRVERLRALATDDLPFE